MLRDILDKRAKQLLKTLIQRYIADGQPVGSHTLSKYSGLELSPATIRKVMSELEKCGFLESPHTSSGRIPTPRGYRLFVDTMLAYDPTLNNNELTSSLMKKIQPDQPKKVAATAANLLSNMSSFIGVAFTPRKSHTFKQIEFVRLSPKRILIIIVTPDENVQNRILHCDREYSSSDLIESANYINTHFSGLSFSEVRKMLNAEISSLRSNMLSLMEQAVTAVAETQNEEDSLLIAGERNLLDVVDLHVSVEDLRQLFALLDKRTGLLHLLDTISHAQGIQIFIGGDSALLPVRDTTIIASPYKVDGKLVGVLGVIGPTRMPYDRVVPIVDIIAHLVSSVLNFL